MYQIFIKLQVAPLLYINYNSISELSTHLGREGLPVTRSTTLSRQDSIRCDFLILGSQGVLTYPIRPRPDSQPSVVCQTSKRHPSLSTVKFSLTYSVPLCFSGISRGTFLITPTPYNSQRGFVLTILLLFPSLYLPRPPVPVVRLFLSFPLLNVFL